MLVGAVGGLRDATKITAAKLQALDGNNQGVSTLNAVNMLGWTGDNMNQSLATAIWKDRLKVSYKDMEGYGKYTQGEDKIVISSTLLGGGSEGSAKLAAAFSHEGTHFFGNRVEGLAHMQAAGTYDTINRMFGLESNTDFSNEMIDGILDSRSWVENTGDTDYWKLMEDGSLKYDGDGWLKDSNNNYITDVKGNRIGADAIEGGLLKIFGWEDNQENRTKAVAMMERNGMTEKESGVWWGHAGNEGTSISINDSEYGTVYGNRLFEHNTLNIYNVLVANGTMDLNPVYKETTEKWWYKSLSAIGLGGAADHLAGIDKYISYEEYKANNFIQGMPEVAARAPIAEGSMISSLFGATGNASIYPHRGIDFAVGNVNVYPMFTNDTTIADVFQSVSDLSSPQGRHVDLTTDVTYVFKGEQRTDQILQRMLHLSSAAVNRFDAVTINTLLGVSGNTGQWNGSGYPLHLHTDISAGQNRSPWLDYLSMNYASPILSSYSYIEDNRVYYDPLIFLHRYNYPVQNGANQYNR